MPEMDVSWVDEELLASVKQEVDQHPSRVKYINTLRRATRHYKSSDEWWVPVSSIDDVNIGPKHPNSRENIIRSSILEANSILLKNDPMAITHPYNPADADLSDGMDKMLMGAWRNAGTRHVLRSMHKQSMLCGLSVGKVGWDPSNKRRGADGDVAIIRCVPGDIRLDPYAPNEQRGRGIRYALHTTRQTPEAIVYRYEDEGAVALGLRSPAGRKSDTIARYLKMLKERLVPIVGQQTQKGEIVDRRVPVDELWLFPVTTRESDLAIGNVVEEKKFPYGLVATFINDRRVRLMANPFAKRRRIAIPISPTELEERDVELGHKLHPFVLLYWIREDDEDGVSGIYDCEGAVKHQIPIQFTYNSLSRNTEINARTSANPPFTYISDALVIPEKRVTLGPGEGIPINPKYSQNLDNAIRFHPGRELPVFVQQLMRDKKDAIKDAVGLKPGMVGLQPQGTSHTETEAVTTLQEASFSKMWTPTDELVACIGEVATRYLGVMQLHYKIGRYVDVSVDGATQFAQVQERHIASQFSVEVISGTTTPMFDMERTVRQAEIKVQVDQAIASGSTDLMMSTVVYLRNIRYPYVHNWIQLLLRKIEEIQQVQQRLQQLGAVGIAGRLQGGLGQGEQTAGGPLALPEAGSPAGVGSDLDGLAAELGVSAEDLMAAFQE
jgi:hypothetical protein